MTTNTALSSLGSPNPFHSYDHVSMIHLFMHTHDKHHDNKPLLPVQIDGQLLHIALVLGFIDTAIENCLMIYCLLDTGACMSSGYNVFWLTIQKAHPECIADLYTSDNCEYNPLVLGVVVTDQDVNMSNHTMKLTLVG